MSESSARLENKIFSIFSELATTLGYSPIHGKIIGSLLVAGKPMSLSELSGMTGYSSSMVSLSIDLLGVLGVVKKVKVMGDRKLYVKLEGDLLEILKNAVVIKVKHGIDGSLKDLGELMKDAEKLEGKDRESVIRTITILENEIKRLQVYINLLSGIRLPHKEI